MFEEREGSNLMFFLVGGFIGAAVALLFAPQSGEETRTFLQDKAQEGKEYVTEKGQQVKDQVRTYVNQGKEVAREKMDRMAEAVKS